MISARITGLLRFLIGIVLLQTTTALLTYAALVSNPGQNVWLFVALGALLGLTVALWFDSVLTTLREQTMARQHKRHSKEREKLQQRAEQERKNLQQRAEQEREKLRVQAERDRTRLTAQNKKAMGGARLRTGVTVGGVVGVGVAMMLAQFMTLGLLTVAGAGGAALGYSVRVRQEKRLRAREARSAERLIVDQSAVGKLEGAMKDVTPKRDRKSKKTV